MEPDRLIETWNVFAQTFKLNDRHVEGTGIPKVNICCAINLYSFDLYLEHNCRPIGICLLESVSSLFPDQERRDVDRVTRAIVRHDEHLRVLSLIVTDDRHVCSCFLNVSDLGDECAVASVEKDDGEFESDVVMENLAIGLLVEHILCEGVATHLVSERDEHLTKL